MKNKSKKQQALRTILQSKFLQFYDYVQDGHFSCAREFFKDPFKSENKEKDCEKNSITGALISQGAEDSKLGLITEGNEES